MSIRKGANVSARVVRVEPFGVFVQVLDGSETFPGFIRRQDWGWSRRTIDLKRRVQIGDVLDVKALEQDGNRWLLSRKDAIPDPYASFRRQHKIGQAVAGQVELIAQKDAGVLIELDDGVEGFIPRSEIPASGQEEDGFGLLVRDWVAARILRFGPKTVILSIKEHIRRRDEDYAASRSGDWQALRYHPALGLDLEGLYWNLQLQEIAEPRISAEVRERIRRILVVEDSENVSESLSMILTHFDFECDVAGTIESAREHLRGKTYDLMIVDVNLPSANGVELLRELPEASTPRYIFVLTATAASEWMRIVDDQTAPLTCVFQKPTPVHRLFEQLNRQIASDAPEDDRRHAPGLGLGNSDDEPPIAWSGARHSETFQRQIDAQIEALRRDLGVDRVFLLGYRQGPIFERISGDFPELTREVQQNLEASPIGDIIRERRFLALNDVTTRRDWFKHLLQVLPVGSFAGLALDYADQASYGLFLIGEPPNQLRRLDEKTLRTAAARLGQILAERRFNEVIAENQGLLLTGFLADSLLHEIKNELQALDDYSAVQLLLSRRYPEDLSRMQQQEQVEFTRATVGVRQASQRLNELVVLFRNLAGHSPAERIELNPVITRLRETLKPFADEHDVTIDLDLDEDVPELLVQPKFIDQPILNLMINGIEHMAQTGASPRRLCVATRHLPDAEFPVRVMIADTGRGVHQVDRDRIFDLFFTFKPHGTGLGLYISRFFVERFGGRLLLAESMMFSGSEFWIEIPRGALT